MESTRKDAEALGACCAALNVAVTFRTLVTRRMTILVDPRTIDGREIDGRLRSAGVVQPEMNAVAGPQPPQMFLMLAGRSMFAGLAAAHANFDQSSNPESKIKPGFSILSGLTWPDPKAKGLSPIGRLVLPVMVNL
jgi:hypothetical protein